MDEQVLKELRNFDAVWNRVSAAAGGEGTRGAPAAKPFDEAKTLEAFICGELRDSRFYAALARGAGGMSGALLRIAEEERGHMRALCVEYFLLTGRRCRPKSTCPVVCGALSALRLAHENEIKGASAYTAAAEETDSERLGGLYRTLAADEEAHAAKLRSLIGWALANGT